MAKKITKIKLSNYRAYYGNYEDLTLPNGQNLLIYGENGSGKSSLYKAVNNFLQSSLNLSLKYVKNRYQEHLEGAVIIEFSEIDPNSKDVVIGSEKEYTFGSDHSTNNVPFITTSSLVKGFLDYTDLLKVYFHKEEQPNLFDLIVFVLLGEHIPTASGGNFKFKARWDQLQYDLIKRAYTRLYNCHKYALTQLPLYETHLRSTLNLVFAELNRMLNTYFKELRIQLSYRLKPIIFLYHNHKWEWETVCDLRLNIVKDGIQVVGNYSDLLNEARLSAIAICLYLASLKQNPTKVELQILYLDDVFIGLDAGNRLPILDIIKKEFPTYQVFISTYDRHWFELSKKFFEANDEKNWLTYEIFAGNEHISNNIITRPIIVAGETNFERAVQFLHNRIKPDYPAAANYFRKAFEELIQKYIPKWELVNNENIQYADHKLTVLLKSTKAFLDKTQNSNESITKVIGLLHNLLHPLSHHEISSPIYKAELIILENAFVNLRDQLKAMDIINNYKCLMEFRKKIRITFYIDPSNTYKAFYELVLKDALILIRDPSGNHTISACGCYLENVCGTKNGTNLPAYNPKKNDPNFQYPSIDNAYDTIQNYLRNQNSINFPKPRNIFNDIEYFDGLIWQPLLPRMTF